MKGGEARREGEMLARLPRGRHGLPREFVVKNQRDRIAAALIEVTVGQGYEAASITRIAAAAGLSRRTFYDYYPDRAAAFTDVYAQVTDFLCGAMVGAGEEAGGGWPGRVRAELAELLSTFAVNPDLARFTLLVAPAAGGGAAAAYPDFLGRLGALLSTGRPRSAGRPSAAAASVAVGGVVALIVRAIEEGRAENLAALLPELVEFVLSVHLGRAAVMRTARPR